MEEWFGRVSCHRPGTAGKIVVPADEIKEKDIVYLRGVPHTVVSVGEKLANKDVLVGFSDGEIYHSTNLDLFPAPFRRSCPMFGGFKLSQIMEGTMPFTKQQQRVSLFYTDSGYTLYLSDWEDGTFRLDVSLVDGLQSNFSISTVYHKDRAVDLEIVSNNASKLGQERFCIDEANAFSSDLSRTISIAKSVVEIFIDDWGSTKEELDDIANEVRMFC